MTGPLLSDAWFAELTTRLAAVRLEEASAPFALGQLVLGGPNGDVGYTIVCASGDATVVRDLTAADVTLVEDYATASALASGTPVAELLLAGRIKVRGDLSLLLAADGVLAALASALAPS